MKDRVNIFWFRRDLRLEDNCGLYHALKEDLPVIPLFIFDSNILKPLRNRDDRRVNFIYGALSTLKAKIEKQGGSMLIKYGDPQNVFAGLTGDYDISMVFTNHDYEPHATSRNISVKNYLESQGIGLFSFKDQVIFEKKEVVKEDGKPYTVFTPYMRKWKTAFSNHKSDHYGSEKMLSNLHKMKPLPFPSFEDIGFIGKNYSYPPPVPDPEIIRNYHLTRDLPWKEGTSRLGVHLRFGTVSIRRIVRMASEMNEVFLNELIWREFFMMILWNFPRVQHQSFRISYDNIPWRNNESDFRAWCNGETGYPLVDAGMRQLSATGYMHNRVRMITASFLAKHLLVDWRWGEAWFAEKLLDFELSSNNGGWQWAAGSGCDAAPYFRVFNPVLQQKKFDPEFRYINKWVPEFGSPQYTKPVVDHKLARERAIKTFSNTIR